MKQLLFTSAVAAVVAAFTSAQNSFSAHDVTRELRRQANTGEVDLLDLTRENVDGVPNTFRIEHNKVREEVAAQLGALRGTYERDFSRGYTLYRPKANAYATLATSVPTAPVNLANAPLTTFGVGSTATPDPDRSKKVSIYLIRKHGAGDNPSLKQIQSRLKGDYVTCSELADLVKTLGYQVSVNPSCPSQSVVTL